MKKMIFLILIGVFSLNLFGSETKSGTVFNLNPVPVDAGFSILCYAESTPLESLIYNPAYAVPNDYKIGISTEIMPLDMYYNSIMYIGKAPFGQFTGLGVIVKYFTSGSIMKFDDSGFQSGNFTVNDFSVSGILATKLKPDLFTGIRINILNEKIINSKTGFSFDAGLGYLASLFKSTRLVFGFTLLNVGTKIYNESQATGIGTGILFENQVSRKDSIQYGIGFRWRSGLDYEVGPSIRYNGNIKIDGGNKLLKYKVGFSYYYSERSRQNGFLQGLKFGILIDSPYKVIFGYQAIFYPWGMGNQIFIGYRIIKESDRTRYDLKGASYEKTSKAEESKEEGEMITCPNCGARISAKSKFCPECGARILNKQEKKAPKYCPNCGYKLEPGIKFCPECGYKVSD